MSKIQDALQKLQNRAGAPESPKKRLRNGVDIDPDSHRRPKQAAQGSPSLHHVNLPDLEDAGLIPPTDYMQTVADEFRRIKRPLINNAFDDSDNTGGHKNVLMITSGLPKAGKTFCAVNLAVSVAQERDLEVLLVDADVAKPHVSRAFGLEDRIGLIDLLVDDTASVRSAVVPTDFHNIMVLAAGRAHPQATELLASGRMADVVDDLATSYRDRLIIIDSPPLLLTNEAHAISGQVGQIAVVIEFGKTSKQTVDEILETIDSDKAVNVIFNKSEQWNRRELYGYGYGYYSDDVEAT